MGVGGVDDPFRLFHFELSTSDLPSLTLLRKTRVANTVFLWNLSSNVLCESCVLATGHVSGWQVVGGEHGTAWPDVGQHRSRSNAYS